MLAGFVRNIGGGKRKAPQTLVCSALLKIKVLEVLGLLGELVVAAEHIGNFVLVEFYHEVASGTAVFAGVELSWLFGKHLANGGSEGQAAVAVDVDFANSAGCSLAELLFRNTYCVGQLSAIGVNHVHILLRYTA